jgi:glycosyltransferase involved in cell wall biosynthesis
MSFKSFIEAVDHILNDDRVDEILIIDDKSKPESIKYLEEFIIELNNKKIKLIKNEVNLGMYKNKIYAISQATYAQGPHIGDIGPRQRHARNDRKAVPRWRRCLPREHEPWRASRQGAADRQYPRA